MQVFIVAAIPSDLQYSFASEVMYVEIVSSSVNTEDLRNYGHVMNSSHYVARTCTDLFSEVEKAS